MIRPRKDGSKDLPKNLYWHKTLQRFYYKHPITDKITYFDPGEDRDVVINTAHICNQELTKKVAKADVILGSIMSMSKWCEHFENVILPKKKLAANTLRDYKNQLKRIKLHYKDADISTMTVLDVSTFLDKIAETAPVLSNRTRSLMMLLFKHAIAKGYLENNLAEQTMPVTNEKQRKRLTYKQFKAIFNFKQEVNGEIIETPTFLKIAMRLAFVTVQREGDVAKMRYDDIVDGALRVKQEKTGKQIGIHIFNDLQRVINDSRDSVLSPYIVHRDPKKNIAFKGRTHYTQCSKEYISKAFSRMRDLLPEFKNMKEAEKPTFHEIRATAIKWYEDQGIDIQHLAGHSSREMTEHYKKGHNDWQTVKVSGIKIEF
jgi:integrase